MYKAIIEIPKGCSRRIHLRFDKTGFIDLGEIKEKIPINNGVMPVDYGFIEGTKNPFEDDDIDVIILSNNIFKTGDTVKIKPIGLLRRDDNDDKVLAVDKTVKMENWDEVPEEQQQLILDFFGYNHKILEVGDSIEGNNYIKEYIIKENE